MVTPEQIFRYEQPSSVLSQDGQVQVHLGTSGGSSVRTSDSLPFFFSGFLNHSEVAATSLAACGLVARTRYYSPPNMVAATIRAADPVITSNEDRLRFEAFSVCGGVYLRYDILPTGLESTPTEYGTTNVDFNAPTRRALSRVRGSEPLHLQVGSTQVQVHTLDGSTVEKKVPLPLRWLTGFAEVQLAASRMQLHGELSGVAGRRFLRSLPASARGPLWVVPAGSSLRLTATPSPGAVCLTDPARLSALEPILRFADALRLYGPSVDGATDSAASAWELTVPGGRVVVVLSPSVSRGFAGEGGALDDLSDDALTDAADVVGGMLTRGPKIDSAELARDTGLDELTVSRALTCLGSAGRVGFDLVENAYFHRELPYDVAVVESLHPRLRDARTIFEAGGVTRTPTGARVAGRGGDHLVTITADGHSCTCPWWGRHRGDRGPCKHALAARLALT